MNKKIEAQADDVGLTGMDGREVRGSFTGRVRIKGKKALVDLRHVDVETENSADIALRRLTGVDARPHVAADEDDEDDI